MISGVGAPALRADVTALLIGCVFFLASRTIAGCVISSASSSISRTHHWR